MLHVCNKLWVRSFPRQENRLFLPPHSRKTQITPFCFFFFFPEGLALFTIPSLCKLTTWAWPIRFCQAFFLFPGCVHKTFATWPVRGSYALTALRCHDPDPVRSMVRQLHYVSLVHPPSYTNPHLVITFKIQVFLLFFLRT